MAVCFLPPHKGKVRQLPERKSFAIQPQNKDIVHWLSRMLHSFLRICCSVYRHILLGIFPSSQGPQTTPIKRVMFTWVIVP